MGARGIEQVITATLQRPTILRVQIVHTSSVGATADFYAVRSVIERAHDRMHAMLGAHETDSQMSVCLERLRRKIAAALGTSAVRLFLPATFHSLTLV